MNSVWTNLC